LEIPDLDLIKQAKQGVPLSSLAGAATADAA
jgi:hypothetical protein